MYISEACRLRDRYRVNWKFMINSHEDPRCHWIIPNIISDGQRDSPSDKENLPNFEGKFNWTCNRTEGDHYDKDSSGQQIWDSRIPNLRVTE
jgi:hypothetical protein